MSSVYDITDAELVRRAVQSARAAVPKGRKHPRWVAVMEVFNLGYGYSCELCIRFGLNPNDVVSR